MNKLIIGSVFLLSVVWAKTVNAQVSVASASQKFQVFFVPDNSLNHNSASSVEVSENIQKRFQKQFPNVNSEAWMKTDNGFVVRFTSGPIQNWIFLNRKASVLGQMRYYGESKLPCVIRNQVKSKYYDYKIISVQEITVANACVYLVSIQANNEWKIIRVSEDQVDVYKEYEDGRFETNKN